MKQAASNSSEKHLRDVNWKLNIAVHWFLFSSIERVDIQMLFSECCWNKDNPDQFGWTKMENGLRYVWRVRIMGSGPRKVQQKKNIQSNRYCFVLKEKI